MSLTLYFHPMSQPSRAVLSFILLNNIPHSLKVIDLGKKETKTADFLKINPLGKLPAIDDDGFKLGESEAIVRYLINTRRIDDNFYPANPRERAQIDKFFPFYHTIFRPSMIKYFLITYPFLKGNVTQITMASNKEDAKAGTEAGCKQFEDVFLVKKKYIMGDNISVADLFAVNELTQVALTTDFDFNTLPTIKDYIDRCLEIPVLNELQKPVREFPVQMRQYMEKKKAKEAKQQ